MKNSLVFKFWDGFERPKNKCWNWFKGKDSLGYGHVWDVSGSRLTHRVSWLLFFGPIPDGLCVLHKCDNPSCVNPDHLFLGTKGDNNRDAKQKGRQRGYFVAGDKHPNAVLSKGIVIKMRKLKDFGWSFLKIANYFNKKYDTTYRAITKKRWTST